MPITRVDVAVANQPRRPPLANSSGAKAYKQLPILMSVSRCFRWGGRRLSTAERLSRRGSAIHHAGVHRLTTFAPCIHGSMLGFAIETIRTATIRTTATASATT
jgi:hypothetical protein